MVELLYEERMMSRIEAKKSLFNVLKYKIDDHEVLIKLIDEVIRVNIELGNYKVYYKFLHKEYKRQIEEKWNYLHRKIDVRPRTHK